MIHFECTKLLFAATTIACSMAVCGIIGGIAASDKPNDVAERQWGRWVKLPLAKDALSLSHDNSVVLAGYLDDKQQRPISLNTWMSAYACYSDDALSMRHALLAQLGCFCMDRRLAAIMWYREDRRVCRVLCLAFCAYLYPREPLSGDFIDVMTPDKPENTARALTQFRSACKRFEAKERKEREDEIEYVASNIVDFRRRIADLGLEARKVVETKRGYIGSDSNRAQLTHDAADVDLANLRP